MKSFKIYVTVLAGLRGDTIRVPDYQEHLAAVTEDSAAALAQAIGLVGHAFTWPSPRAVKPTMKVAMVLSVRVEENGDEGGRP